MSKFNKNNDPGFLRLRGYRPRWVRLDLKGSLSICSGLFAVMCQHYALAQASIPVEEVWVGSNPIPNANDWFDSANWRPRDIPNSSTPKTTIDNGTIALISRSDAFAGDVLNISNKNSRLVIDQLGSLTFGTANVTQGGALQIGDIGSTGVVGDIKLTNGLLFFTPSGEPIRYGGAISGDDPAATLCPQATSCTGLNFQTGTVVLGGASSYSGQTTIFSGATVTLENANALQNSIIILRQNGNLQLNSANATTTIGGLNDDPAGGAGNLDLGSATLIIGNNVAQNNGARYGGIISGTGGLVKVGAGTQVLTGENTYTGLTTIRQGALQVGDEGIDNGTHGSIVGNVVDNGILRFKRSDSITFGGVISGSGQVVQSGSGTLTLSGANTYTGGTLVNAGILAGDATSLQGNIINNAQVAFHQGADGAYAGSMSGAGSLLKDGGGTLVLTGTNTYGGGTTVNAGALVGNAASLQGNIANNAQVIFHQVQDGAYAGAMSGTGSLLKGGVGTLTLTGANTYGGGTTVNAGVLAGSTTSLQGNIVNNAQVAFLQAVDGTYAGAMSGTGSLFKGGAGTLDLAGANTYSGETRINQGTLMVSGNGPHVFGGDVVNQASFSARQTSVEFRGNFVDNGAYTSDGAVNQFNNLSVGPAGYLVGGVNDQFIVTGDFQNASNQGKLWNTSQSSLVFSGSASGQTSHTMQLVGADKGASSQAAKNNFSWGSVTLSSGNQLALANGNANGTKPALYVQRLVLPGGSSQLGSITSNYNIYFDPTNPTNQYLLGQSRFGGGSGLLLPWNFSPQLSQGPLFSGLTPDQQDFAVALDHACATPQGALAARCQELQGLTPQQKKQAAQSLTPDQVPGQTGVGTQFRANRMDAPLTRLAGLRHGQSTPLAFNFNGIQIASRSLDSLAGGGGAAGDDTEPAQGGEPLRDSPLGAFIQGRFSFGDMDQNIWQRGYHFDSRNLTLGADYRFTDQMVAGVLFNYINTNAQYGQNSGGMNSNSYLGALYGSYYLPMDFYVDWVASYGGHDYGFTRQYSYTGFVGQAKSQPSGNQYGFALNGGKDLAWEGWLFSPYTRFEYTNLKIDSYQERGGDGFAMSVGGQTAHSFVSDLGVQVSHAFSLSWAVLTPAIRVEWEHQYLNNNRQVQMSLLDAAAGTGGFVIQTGQPDRDYVNLGGSVVATLPYGGSGFLRYESRLGQSDITQHIVEFGVRMSF